jgi:hypothetical protein
MNYQLVVIIMPDCNKNYPYVYDVINSKDKKQTIDKLKAVLRYSCICNNIKCNDAKSSDDSDVSNDNNIEDDPEHWPSFGHKRITYDEYSISMDTCKELIPYPHWCHSRYVIFVKKENYTINEILQDIQIY